ncbi:hypothetical protein [Marinomonas lutimaris]|uniref:hypothetical protein n=1 Tax=Marinomonas lutimaris TaxID=2846746 RepID=UPI001CA57494|nr:hypothetical protein [Marinomonas lutimaris]
MDAAEKLKQLALNWTPYKYCYFSSSDGNRCSNRIVNAHTIQKSGGLKNISAKSHVMYFKPIFHNIMKNNGKFAPKLEGIKKASTFFGFCSVHDAELFSPIENNVFIDCEEHSLLLGYRTFCKEIYAKSEQMRMHQESYKILKDDHSDPQLLRNLDMQYHGMELAESELSSLKFYLENLIVNKRYESVKFLSIRTASLTEFMCSGALIPEISFNGYYIQYLGQPKHSSDYLSLNIFSSDLGGVILFQWVDESQKNIGFLLDLLKKGLKNIPEYITRFVFEFLENTFMSPLWWNSLSQTDKKIIQNRVMNFSDHESNCLSEGKVASVDWDITSIKTNVVELKPYEI